MDQFFIDACDEMEERLGREALYEEIMEFLEAKLNGEEELFLIRKEKEFYNKN